MNECAEWGQRRQDCRVRLKHRRLRVERREIDPSPDLRLVRQRLIGKDGLIRLPEPPLTLAEHDDGRGDDDRQDQQSEEDFDERKTAGLRHV